MYEYVCYAMCGIEFKSMLLGYEYHPPVQGESCVLHVIYVGCLAILEKW